MKQFKKQLSLLLVIALCASLLAVPAIATTPNEAKVNDVEYATLVEAIANANPGDTVTLLTDVTASTAIVINKALTLDGNGKTLTSSASRAINVGKENCTTNGVTIKNLTINAGGERAINVIQGATNITISSVTATAKNNVVNVASSAPKAVVTIENSNLTGLNVVNVASVEAKITVTGCTLVCNDQNPTENYGTLFLNKDAVGATITASNITFDIRGASRKACNGAPNGLITIDGSEEEITQMVAIFVTVDDYYYSFTSLEGAVAYANTGATIQLMKDITLSEDLTIDKNITLLGMEYLTVQEDAKLSISTGTYDQDVSKYCADGFKSVANEDGTYYVTQKVDLPEVAITEVADENAPPLTFALNFAIKDMESLTEEYLTDLMLGYGHYYTDYVLTIKGLTDEDITFNALDETSDGYLSGQYDGWSENWVSVPFDDVTLANGESIYIMEYAAKLMQKPGLRFTLAEVAEIVVNFDCGVFFTEEFLKANHDMKVTLELKVFTEDENGNIIDDIPVAVNVFNLHNTTEVPAKAKTCTTNGNIAHWKCECGKLFKDEEATTPLTAEDVVVKASHTLEKSAAVDATCTKEGSKEHYKCTACSKLFSDKDCTNEVTAKDLVVAMKSHTLEKKDEVPATYTAPGTIAHYLCSVCKKTFFDDAGKNPITKLEIPQLIEVVGDKAKVSEGAVDVAIEAAGTTGEVKLDLTHDEVIGEENSPVSSADLPVASLEKVAEADASLTLTKADATVTLDAKALEAVAEQAEGTTVTLVVEEIKTEELTQTQQTAIKEKKVAVVISAELICTETNKPIGTEAAGGFGSGTVTVKIPFTPEEGFKGTDYMVYYVADNGTITPVTTGYADGHLIIELEHFSDYVVINTAAEEETTPTEPTVPEETTKPTEPAVPEETTKPTEPTVPETTVPQETAKPTEPTVPETTVPQETAKPTEATKPTNPAVPDTGDHGIVLPLVMMLVCGTAAVCLLSKKKSLF